MDSKRQVTLPIAFRVPETAIERLDQLVEQRRRERPAEVVTRGTYLRDLLLAALREP